MEIVGQHHLVIIQENGVNKRINQHLALRFPGNIHLSKPFKKKAELFFGNSRFCQLFNRDFVFEFIPRCFQLVQALFCRSCEDTLLNGVQQIVNGGLCFSQLLLVQRKIDVFFIL